MDNKQKTNAAQTVPEAPGKFSAFMPILGTLGAAFALAVVKHFTTPKPASSTSKSPTSPVR